MSMLLPVPTKARDEMFTRNPGLADDDTASEAALLGVDPPLPLATSV